MKKIIFVTRQMVMGGIEKALISMLETIPKDEFDITILVMANGGELVDDLPDYVKVKCLFGDEQSTRERVINDFKKGKFAAAFKTGYYSLLARKAKTVFEQEFYHSKMLPKGKERYDMAIAFHTPASFPVVYVIDNIIANKKVAWIHSDVTQYERELQPYKEYYSKFDKVFCVSKYAMDKFTDMYPDLKKRTAVFYNIIDCIKMDKLSMEKGFEDRFNGTKILTVGRLTSQKGQDLIPSILKLLTLAGFKIRWYCIGEGEGRAELENLIKKNQLEEHLILLGNLNNPYPYMKQCDIYVQPSRHEGYCITLAEARAFNKPIITTDFVGAREQIIDGETGIIVDFDNRQIFEQISLLLKNTSFKQQLQCNLKQNDLSNKTNVENLLKVLKQ
ncbi:glycosyltransferase [Metabacillus sp. 113a]|uniref:glycosyltransferase n=1 Tax=Metabacillus sp. 113a TaxID=3404706 RepID=UPI003CF7088E